jgi:hypothetical protein
MDHKKSKGLNSRQLESSRSLNIPVPGKFHVMKILMIYWRTALYCGNVNFKEGNYKDYYETARL